MTSSRLPTLLFGLSRQADTGPIIAPQSMPLRAPRPGPHSHSGTKLTIPILQTLLWPPVFDCPRTSYMLLLYSPTDLEDLEPPWVRADNNLLCRQWVNSSSFPNTQRQNPLSLFLVCRLPESHLPPSGPCEESLSKQAWKHASTVSDKKRPLKDSSVRRGPQ